MIYVECYWDVALVKHILGVEKGEKIQHSFGIGNIAKQLKKSGQVLAMVDADQGKTKPSYLRDLKMLKKFDYGVCVLIDHERKNLVVQLDPHLEGFLLKLISYKDGKSSFDRLGVPVKERALHDFLANQTGVSKLKGLLEHLEKEKLGPLQELRKVFQTAKAELGSQAKP